MSESSEKRRFQRFSLPIVIDAPDLSDVAIVPDDISGSGFKAEVTKEPDQGSVFECSLHVLGEIFEKCEAKVVWVRQTEGAPPSWEVGISLESLAEGHERLAEVLGEVRRQLGAA